MRVKEGKEALASHILRLRNQEKYRQMSRRIHRMTGKNIKWGITLVTKKNANGEMIEYIDKEDIENVCLIENITRFSQAKNTPPMTEPLLGDIGVSGIDPNADRIIQGTYIPQEAQTHG